MSETIELVGGAYDGRRIEVPTASEFYRIPVMSSASTALLVEPLPTGEPTYDVLTYRRVGRRDDGVLRYQLEGS